MPKTLCQNAVTSWWHAVWAEEVEQRFRSIVFPLMRKQNTACRQDINRRNWSFKKGVMDRLETGVHHRHRVAPHGVSFWCTYSCSQNGRNTSTQTSRRRHRPYVVRDASALSSDRPTVVGWPFGQTHLASRQASWPVRGSSVKLHEEEHVPTLNRN